ncbi:MAG: hypothetical protein WD768_02065 [Phycisphaeraceae bacterium]
MIRIFIIIALLLMAGKFAGCTSPTGPRWHEHIAPQPVSDPDTIDPETGLPLRREWADQNLPRPLSREAAFAVLLNTDTFAQAYVGFAGSKSVQVDAYQTLLAEPDAAAVFDDLLRRARVPGQLYALCGIYLVAPQKYDEAQRNVLTAEVLAADAEVTHMAGCIIDSASVRELVNNTSPHTARLRRGETILQWFERVKPAEKSVRFDISGGAIPVSFRDAS